MTYLAAIADKITPRQRADDGYGQGKGERTNDRIFIPFRPCRRCKVFLSRMIEREGKRRGATAALVVVVVADDGRRWTTCCNAQRARIIPSPIRLRNDSQIGATIPGSAPPAHFGATSILQFFKARQRVLHVYFILSKQKGLSSSMLGAHCPALSESAEFIEAFLSMSDDFENF